MILGAEIEVEDLGGKMVCVEGRVWVFLLGGKGEFVEETQNLFSAFICSP